MSQTRHITTYDFFPVNQLLYNRNVRLLHFFARSGITRDRTI